MRKARSSFRYFPDAPFTRSICHSAFGGPWPGMTPEELDHARALMLEHAAFSSVEILAFSLRPTSFDILIETPDKLKLSKKEILARIETGFSPVSRDAVLAEMKSRGPEAWERISGQFGTASFFLKRFKQVITRAYHRRRNSSGTLWQSRYDSAFVEPGHASRVVAAWIDHGCMREGMMVSPEESPHCTIGWANAGGKPSREMIREMFSSEKTDAAWPAARRAWRDFCHGEPENPLTRASNLARKPPLTRAELLRHPVPHFHAGIAIGSHDFIERLFELNRDYFEYDRETGPRLIIGQNDPDLFTFRDKGDLRKPPRSSRKRISSQ